jgi:IPT/TIG domain-containing protein/PASTA domain-containing protein
LTRLRQASILLGATVASLAIWAPAAPAENIVLGPPLTSPIIGGSECLQACTISQAALPGAAVASPVDGVVVRWRLLDGTPGKNYSLRILDPRGGLNFFGAGRSAPVVGSGLGVKTFSTALPIHVGQTIGIDMEANANVASQDAAGARYLSFQPPLGEGVVSTGRLEAFSPRVLGFNAEVQQAPAITAVSPESGSVRGGTRVFIFGSELQGASAVSFGGVRAASFKVESDEEISAVAPPRAAAETVPISVTTLAGTATSPTGFAYVADTGGGGGGDNGGGGGTQSTCVVPRLQGKKLKGAKKQLRRANCRIGSARKRKGATARTGRVVRQSLKPGKRLPPGTKVSFTLG